LKIFPILSVWVIQINYKFSIWKIKNHT